MDQNEKYTITYNDFLNITIGNFIRSQIWLFKLGQQKNINFQQLLDFLLYVLKSEIYILIESNIVSANHFHWSVIISQNICSQFKAFRNTT